MRATGPRLKGLRHAWFSVLAAVFLAAPATATQDAWPALFDVAGVAADDVLNIRAAPRTDAPVIGSLAPDATDVEVIFPDERQGWGLVNAGGSTGWVSLAFLQRQPGQWAGAHPLVRRCVGTEPFWSLAVAPDGTAEWSTPEARGISGTVQTRWSSQNRRDRHALSIRLMPLGDGLPDELLATISTGECSDGMSDRRYGLGVDMLVGNVAGARMVSGCCSLAPD